MITPDHPRWDEFTGRLAGPEGCDFQEGDGDAGFTWRCGGGYDKTYSEAILEAMGFTGDEVAESLYYFEQHGGHCDCEVIFNVTPR